MDTTSPVTPVLEPTQQSKPPPSRLTSTIVLIVIIGVLLAIAIFLIFSPKQNKQPKISAPIPTNQPVLPTPKSTPAPIRPNHFNGTITAIHGDSLTVSTTTGPQTFSIANTYDIERVTSGDVTTSNFQATSIKRTDLKAGNKVHIVTDKNTGTTVSVFVTK